MIKYLKNASPSALRGTALLRLDFNTKDDWRMRAVIPTVKKILKTSDKVVVLSHYGRPPLGGKTFDKEFSLRHDARTLGRFLRKKVVFIPHFRFAEIRAEIKSAPKGTVFLLENLRFMKGEEANDRGFAKLLASLGDFYVNDAFAVSHRANASVAAITKFLPSYAGLVMEEEIRSLSRVMVRPKHPMVLVLGGAKAADKLGVITHFKSRADWFLLGGGPANSILWLRGTDVKKSVRDKDPKNLKELKKVERYKNLILPVDFKWQGGTICDMGPKSVKLFTEKIAKAKTIVWSGPLGIFEIPKYAKGGVAVARAIVRNKRAFSVAGGGETVMFLKKYKLDTKFSFISTGGGAMVDFLAGEKLPGIEALR